MHAMVPILFEWWFPTFRTLRACFLTLNLLVWGRGGAHKVLVEAQSHMQAHLSSFSPFVDVVLDAPPSFLLQLDVEPP